MRREYIKYPEGIPVAVDFATIEEYPLHWHNAIEILYVIKGSLSVTISTDTYELSQNSIEIINVDEDHKIFSNDKNNKVLIFHIDPNFWEKYYDDINNMFFYTNTSDKNGQNGEEYDILRTFFSIILCEMVQQNNDYNIRVENTLVDLLYYLINNFNYLVYEQEELKGDDEYLQRYHRISKYIFNNYNDNITLQDIADKEFLSPYYLSHEIKYATGYSFTELINLTRVQEAVKFLLDSEKAISEISEDVGFSHIRYFNKNFKLYYKTTPRNFRKKYKVNEETLEKHKKVKHCDLKDALDYVTYYIEDYDRFNYENKINKITIDVSCSHGRVRKNFKDVITLGDSFYLLIEDNRCIIKRVQNDIGFNYGRLLNMFSTDMGIYKGAKHYNWSRAASVLSYLDTIDMKPLVVLDDNGFSKDEFLSVLVSFLNFLTETNMQNMKSIKFQFAEGFDKEIQKDAVNVLEKNNFKIIKRHFNVPLNINPIYDTSYMLPYILENELNKRGIQELCAFDISDKPDLADEVFFGYPGLVNTEGINKPSFYAYYFLSKLGNTLVAKDNGYIAAKKEGEYQILLYSYNERISNLIELKSYSKLGGLKNSTEKKFSLNLARLPSDVRVTSYLIDEETGSPYNYWLKMGKPERLDKVENDLLYKASFPKLDFKFSHKGTILNLQTKLTGYGAVLIIIKEV